MKLISHIRAIMATRKACMIRRNAIRDYRQAMRLALNLERTALRFKRLSGPPLLSDNGRTAEVLNLRERLAFWVWWRFWFKSPCL